MLVTGRSAERGDSLVDEIAKSGKGSARFYRADLASLDQVRRLADAVLRDNQRLDILVNNAGVGFVFDTVRKFSADGYEMHFAVNYLAHAQLIGDLLDSFVVPARVVGRGPDGTYQNYAAADAASDGRPTLTLGSLSNNVYTYCGAQTVNLRASGGTSYVWMM